MKQLALLLSIFISIAALGSSPIAKNGNADKAVLEHSVAFYSFSGNVVDEETGERLVCAKIEIEETGISIFTDIHGNFSFNSITPGTYTLKVSYISYEDIKMSSPINTDGQEMTISLKPL